MSNTTQHSEVIDGMLSLACRHCGARPGDWCMAPGLRRADRMHTIRYRDWYESLPDEEPDDV